MPKAKITNQVRNEKQIQKAIVESASSNRGRSNARKYFWGRMEKENREK